MTAEDQSQDRMHDLRYSGLGERVFVFVFAGICLAILYSAIATVVVIAGRDSSVHLLLGRIVGTYLLAGLLGGTVAGIMLPLARRKTGAAFLGFVIACIVYGLAAPLVAASGVEATFGGHAVATGMCAAITGIPLGLHFWSEPR
jgi:hypothetical protein